MFPERLAARTEPTKHVAQIYQLFYKHGSQQSSKTEKKMSALKFPEGNSRKFLPVENRLLSKVSLI